MLERIGARLLTGPAAFLLAGILDLLAFAALSAVSAARGRLRRARGSDAPRRSSH